MNKEWSEQQSFGSAKTSSNRAMTFNESTILEDEMEEYLEEIDEYGEETALLIDKMNNPYAEFDPKNFTLQQKLKWMKEEPEEEFQANFEQN